MIPISHSRFTKGGYLVSPCGRQVWSGRSNRALKVSLDGFVTLVDNRGHRVRTRVADLIAGPPKHIPGRSSLWAWSLPLAVTALVMAFFFFMRLPHAQLGPSLQALLLMSRTRQAAGDLVHVLRAMMPAVGGGIEIPGFAQKLYTYSKIY